jgi:hypothetical protein
VLVSLFSSTSVGSTVPVFSGVVVVSSVVVVLLVLVVVPLLSSTPIKVVPFSLSVVSVVFQVVSSQATKANVNIVAIIKPLIYSPLLK